MHKSNKFSMTNFSASLFLAVSVGLAGQASADAWSTSTTAGTPIRTTTTTTKVGIGLTGTTAPRGALDVEGSAVIGAGYSGTSTVTPLSNGLLVEGRASIGSSAPPSNSKFNVNNTGNGPMATFQQNGILMANIDNGGNFTTEGNIVGNSIVAASGDVYVPNGKVIIKQWSMEVPDYVFDEKNHPLKKLDEVERFVKTHKHLPDVPSAADMKKKGMDMAEMNLILLKKVEELTLYVIEQDKKITKLSKNEH